MSEDGYNSADQRATSFDLLSLAPRAHNPPTELSPPNLSPTREQSSTTSSSVRRARLSHRSRAGCWTCRGRKVKCDEQHPRCGQCARLNRDCDWEHRWNFNHATSSTQSRHTNVSTTGSTVWDPSARSSRRSLTKRSSNDNLPAFATLTNDDDREKKARSAIPGTYSVVVTPESFSNLPEYASSESSSPTPRQRPDHGHLSAQSSSNERRSSIIDTNTIVLEHFEDTPPSASLGAAAHSFSSRSSSLPAGSRQPQNHMSYGADQSIFFASRAFASDNGRLAACFDQYLVYRLIPWINDTSCLALPNLATNRDFIRIEATHFAPLQNAIYALSALHLYYAGQAPLAEAVDYYDRALATQTPLDQDEHLSDGVFLRHFLLYVYDIAMALPATHDHPVEASMSATNLAALQKLAMQRHERNGGEKFAHVSWLLGFLDVEACLMGNGDCGYIRNLTQHNSLPSLAMQVPSQTGEEALLSRVLEMQQGVIMQLASLAHLAFSLRTIASSGISPSAVVAQCQSSVLQAQRTLMSAWAQLYPDVLHRNPIRAAEKLPPRIRILFEKAVSLYNAGVIYSHTSMFPRQRSMPNTIPGVTDSEIEACKDIILSIASQLLGNQRFDQRWIIFPVFMVGTASKSSDAMVQALGIIRAYEGYGIGQNTTIVRQLLTAVNDEQSQRVAAGQPMEDIDWQIVAHQRGFRISNCGL